MRWLIVTCISELRLFGDGKLRDNFDDEVDALGNSGQGEALVVAVHAAVVVFDKGKWAEAVGLHTVETQLRGIGRAGGHEGQDGCAAKFLRSDSGDGGVEIVFE